MLASTVSRNVGNYSFPKYWQLQFSEMLAIMFLDMLATNASNYIFRYWRRMLSIIFQNVSDYNVLNCWCQMLATTTFRNAGDEC